MASVDLESTSVSDTPAEPELGPRLSWDESVAASPLGLGWDAEPTVLDWFGGGAGVPDLLVTAGGGPRGRIARVYRRVDSPAGSHHYDAGTPVEALDGLHCVCSIPNSAASRFDLVALDPTGLVFLRNEGAGDVPRFAPREGLGIAADLGIGPCRVVQMVALDWDGDGLTDLLVGIDDLEGYWPDVERLPIAQEVGFNQKGGHPGYDQSGLWRGRAPRGRLFWLKNVGTPSAPAFALQPEIGEEGAVELAPHPAALTISWGGGSSLELLVIDARRLVRIHRNFGGQRPPVLMEPRTLQCGHAPLLLPEDRTLVIAADLDGDRRAELVYGTSDGRIFAVHTGATRNDAKTPAPLLQENAPFRLGGHAVVTAGDLDGDGDLDLVYGDAPGTLHRVDDLGTAHAHRYALPTVVEAGGVVFRIDPGPDGMLDGPAARRIGYACPALADWTGNGRLDLIVNGAGGEVLFLKNDGSATAPRFGVPAALRCDGGPLILPPRVRPAVVDWHGAGTGQPDLIALNLQGFLCVYPRAGHLEVGPPVPLVDRLGRVLRLDGAFGQAGRCALWAGDWTGSGHIDILVGLPCGNRHVIPALTGLPLDRSDDLPTVLLLENLGHGHLVPRPMRHADGRPIIAGTEGCSPNGVPGSGTSGLDLLIGQEDGHVTLLGREELLW